MNAVMVGLGSEIARNLAIRLTADGWVVGGSSRDEPLPAVRWDLAIFAAGTMEPIGRFFETDKNAWAQALCVNALNVLSDLRVLWPLRNVWAKVVFMGGPNMKNPSQTYSAYRCGKAVLEAIAPTLNEEYPEHRFLVLHPGVVRTKIHQQTIDAGERAANIERIKRVVSGEEKTVTHDEVYAKLKELIA